MSKEEGLLLPDDDPILNRIREEVNRQCCKCKKTFQGRENASSMDLAASKGQSTFVCDTCSKTPPPLVSRQRNAKRRSATRGGKKDTHLCDVCGKAFTLRSDLNRHSLIHKGIKDFLCNVCGRCFTRNGDLKKHHLIHEGLKPHPCDVCGKAFTQTGYLKQHLLIHKGIKPHVCDVCGKSFSHKGNFKKHSLLHDDVKPHACDLCGKSFTQRANLKKHSLIHNNVKPHACQFCGKSFTEKGNLTKHISVHKDVNAHFCGQCGDTFPTKDLLGNHLKSHESSQRSCGDLESGNSNPIRSDEPEIDRIDEGDEKPKENQKFICERVNSDTWSTKSENNYDDLVKEEHNIEELNSYDNVIKVQAHDVDEFHFVDMAMHESDFSYAGLKEEYDICDNDGLRKDDDWDIRNYLCH